jgi:hypothetical protein
MPKNILSIIEYLPGYKILAIASKEINLIKNQKVALALLIIYPLIVILTLGTAYSGGTSIGKVDVALYVPNKVSGLETQKLVEKLNKSDSIKLIKVNDEQQVREMIMKRKAKVGIIVRDPEPTQGRFVVDIINDNSNIINSVFFFQVASDSIRSIGFQTSQEMLSEIWAGLDTIKQKIQSEADKINEFTNKLGEVEDQIIDLNKTINSIDVEEMRTKLQSQKRMIDELEPKITLFQQKINSFSELKQRNSKRIKDAKIKIAEYKTIINSVDSQSKEAKAYCTSEKYANAVKSTPELKDLCNKIISSFNDLQKIVNEFNSLESELTEAEREFDSIEIELNNASKDLQTIKQRFSQAQGDINYFNNQLSSLEKTMNKVNGLIGSAVETEKSIRNDLKDAAKILDSFIYNIRQLSMVSPQFLSNPVIINKNSIYKASKLEIITPIALVLVIMLTAILLTGVSFVNERNEGAYSRLVLSPTSKLELFLGKVFGQLILSVLEAGIIMFVAIFFFGVRISGVSITIFDIFDIITGKSNIVQVFAPVFSINFMLGLLNLFAVTTIIGFAFICLGLFISNYTKMQSTTILAGLLAVIPMIFISGIIIPMEFMSEIVQQVSFIQPLNLGIVIATEAIIKGTMLTNLVSESIKMVIPALIFFLFTLSNKNL